MKRQSNIDILVPQTTLGPSHNKDKQNKTIQHRTKKMSNTNSLLKPGVREVSCSSSCFL